MSASVVANKQALLESQASREVVVEPLPYDYRIHIAMPCNQACIMCVPDFNHPRDILPFEGFVALFDQIKQAASHITLIGGETFMYPWIREALQLIAQHPIEVTVHTNSFMLNDRVAEPLLSLHELNLKCSIDAGTRETYRKIRGRDHFDRVVANMRRFSEMASDKPNIRMMTNYVVMRENLDEVLPFIDFAATLSLYRAEFHPVRHVETWQVSNGTGWHFDGRRQSCQFFRDEYNDVMRQAAEKCTQLGLRHEVVYV